MLIVVQYHLFLDRFSSERNRHIWNRRGSIARIADIPIAKCATEIGEAVGPIEDLITGVVLLLVGLLLIVKWEHLVQIAISSGNRAWGRIGIPQASEKSRRMGARIIAQTIGAVWVIAGLAELFMFVTGHDWPFHYR